MSIVTDLESLRKPCSPVSSIKEGLGIARKLWAELGRVNARARRPLKEDEILRLKAGENVRPHGLGLAAIQIGIAKRVCVVDVGGYREVLINPVVVKRSETCFPHKEGCLSIPGQQFDTWRYQWVVVASLQHPEGKLYGPKTIDTWGKNSLLLSYVVQHEVSHCYGLLVSDFTDEAKDPLYWSQNLEKANASC